MRREKSVRKKLREISKEISFNHMIGKRGRDHFAAGDPFLYERKRMLEWVLGGLDEA